MVVSAGFMMHTTQLSSTSTSTSMDQIRKLEIACYDSGNGKVLIKRLPPEGIAVKADNHVF